MAVSRACRIARIGLTTADIDRLEAFYRSVFGFERVAAEALDGPDFAGLMDVRGTGARRTVLRLGRQEISLLAFAGGARPYPLPAAANDPWFQHMAIVVSDMNDAYARLRAHAGWSPVSRDGPQRLPARSGGVTAFKFRDPDGHPLELLEFPSGAAPPAWSSSADADGVFRGIDHSAIVVKDGTRSLDFYRLLLGFVPRATTLNRGPEQQALDAVDAPVVEVTALQLPGAPPPHLELLCYRGPGRARAALRFHSNDVAATRLELAVDDVAAITAVLAGAGVEFVSPPAVALGGGRVAAHVVDPDGHHVLLTSGG